MTSHLKIPRHRSGDVDHVSFSDLYRRMTGKVFSVVHYDRRRATAIIPAVGELLPHVDERIADLEALGSVHVTVDPSFVIDECNWNVHDRPALATVLVYGNPAADDVHSPIELVKVCLACAVGTHGPVFQALVESATDDDIRVEVCE